MRLDLSDLASLDGVQVAILTGRDGLIVASSGDMGEQDELRAALTAAIFGTIGRAILPLDLGAPTEAIIETTTHCLQIACVDEFLVVVFADKSANVGLVRLQMRQAARRLRAFIAGRASKSKLSLPAEAVPSASASSS